MERPHTPVAGFTVRDGDCPGNDIQGLSMFYTTPSQCAARCRIRSECVAFLFSNGACYPKSATCGQPNTDNIRNAFYDSVHPPVAGYMLRVGVCFGNDIQSLVKRGLTPSQCADKCNSNSQCVAFLFSNGLCSPKSATCGQPNTDNPMDAFYDKGNCPSGWQLKGTRCYKAFTISKTWDDASDYCQDQGPGGMLAMAKDGGTNSFLISLKNAKSRSEGFWFGLNDLKKEGQWMWSDDTRHWPRLDFNNWAPNEPNDGGTQWNTREMCAEFLKTGKWNDVRCYMGRYFICERYAEGE
ncbi:COLEC10 [Branchiostoma lanceolatum]|uniref:COLEC10 protein n=1 Tax=Branchiostoma lanceolatum TaxID=7740 RepID=A0A8J9YTL6_BRALA|nr:COLEC10 [Branchiostoma lanceolatum]